MSGDGDGIAWAMIVTSAAGFLQETKQKEMPYVDVS